MESQYLSQDSSQQYTIKPMTRSDLDCAVEWAAIEGWNPGLHDGDCFYQADSTGFWMGVLEEEAIASISAVKYGESFGFIGFYIVKPDVRGKGYGITLWNAAIEFLGDRTIGLDGVLAQQNNYQKSGFQLAHRNVRYEGRGTSNSLTLTQTSQPSQTCVPLSGLAIEDVIAYDRPFFPSDRTAFLIAWLGHPEHYGIGVIEQNTAIEQNTLVGYGLLRPCRTGYKIGPLFADTVPIAQSIFDALRDRIPANIPFYLDVPDVNAKAIGLAEHHQMTPVFETARMYRGTIPDISIDRTYGITTFELG